MRGKELSYTGHATNSAWTDKIENWFLDHGTPYGGLFLLKFIVTFLFLSIFYTGWHGFVQQMNNTYDWSNWLW